VLDRSEQRRALNAHLEFGGSFGAEKSIPLRVASNRRSASFRCPTSVASACGR
jgi:hypothetical protein